MGDDLPAGEAASLPAPNNVRSIGYDRHVEVRWDPVNSSLLDRYVIYRSLDDVAGLSSTKISPIRPFPRVERSDMETSVYKHHFNFSGWN